MWGLLKRSRTRWDGAVVLILLLRCWLAGLDALVWLALVFTDFAYDGEDSLTLCMGIVDTGSSLVAEVVGSLVHAAVDCDDFCLGAYEDEDMQILML